MEQDTKLKAVLDALEGARALLQDMSHPECDIEASLAAAQVLAGQAINTLQTLPESQHVTKALEWVKLAAERLEQGGAKADWPASDMLLVAMCWLQPEPQAA